MKRICLLIGIFAVGAMMFSCGGGGGAKNDYLGNLPGLYAKYNKVEADAKASVEGKNLEQITKLYEDVKAKEDQLKADVAAEMEKIAGREVPVSYSPELQKSFDLFYQAKASITNNRNNPFLSLTLTAKNDLAVPTQSRFEPKFPVWFHFIDKDGASVERSKWSFSVFEFNKPEKSFIKGDQIYVNEIMRDFDVEDYPESYAGFAGVQFITKAEYDNLNYPKK